MNTLTADKRRQAKCTILEEVVFLDKRNGEGKCVCANRSFVGGGTGERKINVQQRLSS